MKISIATLFSKDFLTEEATQKLKRIAEIENKLNRDDLINKTGNKKKDKHIIFWKRNLNKLFITV